MTKLAALATLLLLAAPGGPPSLRALVGATLIDGAGGPPVKDAVVLVRDGRVQCAGPRSACPLPAGAEVTDLSGLWIVPGLIDAHVHFSQTGWADGRPDALDARERYPYEEVVAGLQRHPERFGRSHLCSGVTAVFDVGGYAWTLDLARRAEDDPGMPRVAAAGPLLSTVDHWLNLPAERQFLPIEGERQAREGVRYLAARGSSAVKVWYIVDEDRSVEASAPAVRAAAEEARRRQLPLIVHATGLAEAKEALRAGARLLVHSVEDQPVDEEFLRLAREARAVYCPTLTVGRGYLRMFEAAARRQAPAVDDPNGCVDPETRARVAATAQLPAPVPAARLAALADRLDREAKTAAANLRRVAEAGIPVAMGTDAGNPLTLHGPSVYAEMEAMQAAGLSPGQVLAAATQGGALAMGREKELGTIGKGKLADLLVVGGDPLAGVAKLRQARFVMRGGALLPVRDLAPSVTPR